MELTVRNLKLRFFFIQTGGYYTLLVQPKVRLVALNTNLHYFKATLANTNPDPADQLAWLDDTLTAAANVSEKVVCVQI